MLNLTKEQAILNHRNMWNWIAEQNENGIHYPYQGPLLKFEYIKNHTDFDPNLISCFCFCCEYDNKEDCFYCPLKWDSTLKYLSCIDKNKADDGLGIYSKWNHETDPKEAAKLARIIANLPERSGV